MDDRTARLRFDIEMLAGRLVDITRWLRQDPDTARLAVGYFGASTGGGAALVAAARYPDPGVVNAVVSRGGRPDLAGAALAQVKAPTLLIVGGYDKVVIDLNRQALNQLNSGLTKEMVIVPEASHLFEEAGKLEEVARLATAWFKQYLAGPAPASSRH
jgi:pimeloyl-ACP methyl ester carboxylesterase